MISILTFIIILTLPILKISAKGELSKAENIEIILNKTFFNDPQTEEFTELIAAKGIKDSQKAIEYKQFMNHLRSAMRDPELLKLITKLYENEFTDEEIEQIRILVTNPMFIRFNEKLPNLSKQTMKAQEGIVKDLIQSYPGASIKKPEEQLVSKLTKDNFEQIFGNSSKPIVLDFYADWCIPCQALELMLESVAKDYGKEITFVKINIEEESEIAEKFQVKQLPQVLFINDGKAIRFCI